MTETATNTSNGVVPPASDDDAGGLPVDRLKDAAQSLVRAVAGKAAEAALSQVEGLTDRLTGVAENGGVGLTGALGGGGAALAGQNPVTGALSAGASALKDKVTGALGSVIPGLGGSDDEEEGGSSSGGGSNAGARGKFKFMNIFETQDVGVPLRLAYDQWTQFADFPSFMKKVENVDQSSDEKVTWHAKVFWSKRSWDTTIVEQIPDSHILWTSSGQKGRADGIVTFSELAPNLTRIVLIMEYYPQGLFEKTGNLWRAVGRRARLEFKHFCRYVMMDSLVNRDEIEGWRGEIRGSEVVKTHEEGLEEERAAEEESAELDEDAEYEGDEDAEYEDAEYEDEDDEYEDDELDDADVGEDELDEEEFADAEFADAESGEDEFADEDELEENVAEEEPEDSGGRRSSRRRGRRQPTPA